LETIKLGGDRIGIKTLATVLHIGAATIAAVTSEIQTKRIISTGKKYNSVIIAFFVMGSVLAAGGTVYINNKGNRILHVLNKINNK
jgi:hypothetical protein